MLKVWRREKNCGKNCGKLREKLRKIVEIVEIVEDDLEVSEDEDLQESESESESDDDMISTLYEKTPQLKALDNQLKNKLERLGFNTTEKVSKVFQTFLHINQKYGIPPLEERNPKRMEEFYSSAILNLG